MIFKKRECFVSGFSCGEGIDAKVEGAHPEADVQNPDSGQKKLRGEGS